MTKRQQLGKKHSKKLITNHNKGIHPANPEIILKFIVKQSNAKVAAGRRKMNYLLNVFDLIDMSSSSEEGEFKSFHATT